MPRPARPVLTFVLVAVVLLVAAHALDRLTYERLYNPRVYDQDWGRMLRSLGWVPFWWFAALALGLQDGLGFGRSGPAAVPTEPDGAMPRSAEAGASVAAPRSADAAASPVSPRSTDAAASPASPRSTDVAASPVSPRSTDAAAMSPSRWTRFLVSRGGFLFLAVMAAGLAGEVVKLLVRRERPWAAAGAYVFRPFTDRPFNGSGLAMPSTHTCVAFGAAFALARLFPRAAPVWYILAAGCAFTRVAARAHFLSDAVAGALLAYLAVWLLWSAAGRRTSAARAT